MAREIFEAFKGQQDMFGYSQATRVGDTIYVAGTVGIGEGMHVPEPMAEQMELAYRNVPARSPISGLHVRCGGTAGLRHQHRRGLRRAGGAQGRLRGARISRPHRWWRSAGWRCPS